MDINNWLRKFKEKWENHDIKGVLSLFDSKVIYYETPLLKLNFKEISKEWRVIKDQNQILLNYKILSQKNNKCNIIWKLKYLDKDNKEQKYSGKWLIKLNQEGICNYFFQSFNE